MAHQENSVGKDQEACEEIRVGPRGTKPKKLINFSWVNKPIKSHVDVISSLNPLSLSTILS
jgi:hypothetical protein